MGVTPPPIGTAIFSEPLQQPKIVLYSKKSVYLWLILIVLTVLGHDDNLLVEATDDGFTWLHHNARYTASPPGQRIRYEAYENDVT